MLKIQLDPTSSLTLHNFVTYESFDQLHTSLGNEGTVKVHYFKAKSLHFNCSLIASFQIHCGDVQKQKCVNLQILIDQLYMFTVCMCIYT